jgi:integrase
MARERIYRIIEREVKRGNKTIILTYARSSYTDRQGKRHTLWRSGETRTEAKQRLKEAIDKATGVGDEISPRSTFADLVEFYKTRYAVPAKYKGDIKIEGLRSYQKIISQLKPLSAFFDKMKLIHITHDDIKVYKDRRMNQTYEKGKDAEGQPIVHERSAASVHRELALLRKMLNVAMAQRWITHNPFGRGDSLISVAGEVQRQRILTPEEEERIFQACEMDGRRAHLKPILMCLMDTGMRRNEALRLVWADVDLEAGTIKAVSFKGKMRFERIVGMTRRLKSELTALLERSRGRDDDLVFGVSTDIKRSWMTVRAKAGLNDVRLHDLRHQAATNFIKSGLPLQTVSRLLGHRHFNTTYRYININEQDATDAARLLDKMHSKEED